MSQDMSTYYLWKNLRWKRMVYTLFPQATMQINCGKPKWFLHAGVIKWKRIPRYWPFVRGIRRSPVNSPHKGQWRGALKFSLICVWINGCENNCEAGDLRCHRAHYNVIVMAFYTSDYCKTAQLKIINAITTSRMYFHACELQGIPRVTQTFHLLSLRWRHYESDGVSNHRRLDCLLNCLFRHR